ncbi:MAG: potassium-transporting ATPase subunit KdpA, partial [Pirellulales bacterium]
MALIRGLARRSVETIGNFWVDLTRTTYYILLPMSVAVALLIVSQGVVQNFSTYQTVRLLQVTSYEQAVSDDSSVAGAEAGRVQRESG